MYGCLFSFFAPIAFANGHRGRKMPVIREESDTGEERNTGKEHAPFLVDRLPITENR